MKNLMECEACGNETEWSGKSTTLLNAMVNRLEVCSRREGSYHKQRQDEERKKERAKGRKRKVRKKKTWRKAGEAGRKREETSSGKTRARQKGLDPTWRG